MEANDAFWKLSGLNADQAIGHTLLEFGLWKDMEEWRQLVKELKEKHSIEYLEYPFVSQNGEKHDTLASYELIHLDDQECILAIFYNITGEKKTQEELYQSRGAQSCSSERHSRHDLRAG